MEHGEVGSQQFFDWFYRGDWGEPDAVERRWHPDLVVRQSSDLLDTAGTFHGYEGLRAVFGELAESYKGIVWDPVEVRDLGGDRYLVRINASGEGRGSGIPLEGEMGHLFAFRGERAAELDIYWGWDTALEANGLT